MEILLELMKNFRERCPCKELNQKKYFEDLKFIHEGKSYYPLYFNNKVSQILLRTRTYSFKMEMSYLMEDTQLDYSFFFKDCIIDIILEISKIQINFNFKNYVQQVIDLRSHSWYIYEHLKYYYIDINNKFLDVIVVNTRNINVQNDSEIFFYRNMYVCFNNFDFVLVTKEVVMFLKSDTKILYIYENNININLYKGFGFKNSFELFLRNNNFNFIY